MESGAFFPKKIFVFWWGLRPRPNLPRPWAGPAVTFLRLKSVYGIWPQHPLCESLL